MQDNVVLFDGDPMFFENVTGDKGDSVSDPKGPEPKINKADYYCKEILQYILDNGCWDVNPRPHWEDGTPAHALSINGYMAKFDLSKGEFPLLTLRPVAIKSGIKELLWIYQDQTSDLEVLRNKYNVHFWDDWCIGKNDEGHDWIGHTYGDTVHRLDLMNRFVLDSIKNNPDSRYHILNLWNPQEQLKEHGLKPCAMLSQFIVRHGKDGKTYLDSCLYQRSCDFITATVSTNWSQYAMFNMLVASHFGYLPGVFTWFGMNIQIYDRHINYAKELMKRQSVDLDIRVICNPTCKNFYDVTMDDIQIIGYDREKIEAQNPQIKLPVAV